MKNDFNKISILNLDQWLSRRCRLKIVLIRALVGGAILVEGIMRNISMKVF